MNDEIKEIDRIILNVKRKLQFSPEQRFVELFNKDEINKLLDYITNLQQKNKTTTFGDYKSRCEKAVEYMKDFIFEPLLPQEDRKLIMFNENLRKFENILNGKE